MCCWIPFAKVLLIVCVLIFLRGYWSIIVIILLGLGIAFRSFSALVYVDGYFFLKCLVEFHSGGFVLRVLWAVFKI